jgi:hypothetical protein
MAAKQKYPNLGKTIKIRVPESYVPHIEYLMANYDRITENHDEDYLSKVILNIEKGLGKC